MVIRYALCLILQFNNTLTKTHLLIPILINLMSRRKEIKLIVLITSFLFQINGISGQSLSSILEFHNSYGFRVKRNQVEQYSNIVMCKENKNSLSFICTKITDSKSTKLFTLNLVDGNIEHRQIVLPDSIVTQFRDDNDDVQCIAMNSNIFTMLLLHKVHVFELDETKQKYYFIKSYQLPSVSSEIQMVGSELVIFGSYPTYRDEIRNNYIATIDLTADSAQVKYTYLCGYDASIYHILGGTKYLSIRDDKKAIITDPRKLNQYVIDLNDTEIVLNKLKSLSIANFEASQVSDSSYNLILTKYHNYPVSMYSETMKLHQSTNSSVLSQTWTINENLRMMVMATFDSKKPIPTTKYIFLNKKDSILSVLSRDSFPKTYLYQRSDYRPYANLSLQIFDNEFAIFGRLTSQVDKIGLTQSEVYKKDETRGKLYWAFDVYKWQR